MNSPKNSTNNILFQAQRLAPDVIFRAEPSFYWSPKDNAIAYRAESLEDSEGIWSILHETSHALLKHQMYKTDFELLTLEVAAWEHAKNLAKGLGISVDENYVQDCLDTYRDWLHRRSTCPTCGSVGLQHSPSEYRCHNCNTAWRVSSARFCRPYRRKETDSKESSHSVKNQTTFH